MDAILGRKLGMTQVFTEDGLLIPVTVVEAGPCTIVQTKTVETDGYDAVQVGFGHAKRVNKPQAGHFKKAGVEPLRYLHEYRTIGTPDLETGASYSADIFEQGERVDVSGKSKGKGFLGVVARWGQRRGPMSHGSRYHRRPGSMGACASPSKVMKGKRLPGRAGGKHVTVLDLEVVRVDPEKNIMLIRGGIPGPNGALVSIRRSVKTKAAK